MKILPLISDCRGFTLLEIMTVISIMALLTSVSIPRIDRMIENSRAMQCQTFRSAVERAPRWTTTFPKARLT